MIARRLLSLATPMRCWRWRAQSLRSPPIHPLAPPRFRGRVRRRRACPRARYWSLTPSMGTQQLPLTTVPPAALAIRRAILKARTGRLFMRRLTLHAVRGPSFFILSGGPALSSQGTRAYQAPGRWRGALCGTTFAHRLQLLPSARRIPPSLLCAARQDIPWDDEPDFYPRPLDDGTGDGLSLAPLPPSRGRIPTGLPPGLGPGPLASWGPLQGSHTGPLITGPHPGDPLRRDFDGPGGLGRPATNPSDYFFSVDEALSGSQHARTCVTPLLVAAPTGWVPQCPSSRLGTLQE